MKKISEIIADTWKMPKDVIMDLPKISICGDKEVFIENHKGLDQYDNDCIKIKTDDGLVIIKGENLRIIVLEYTTIVVNGTFKSVEYEKNRRN